MFKKFNGLLLLLLLAVTGCLPAAGGETAVPAAPPATDTPVTLIEMPATDTPTPIVVDDTPTPTVFVDTPAPMCTPPACQENEVYFCSGDCPGGCGTTCATVTPNPNAAPPPPTEWEPLAAWLSSAWQQGTAPTAVQSALLETGWLQSESDWQTADFDGDQQAEWVLLLYPPNADPEIARPANLWVVDDSSVIYRIYNEPNLAGGFSLQLHLTGIQDLTGDGLPELIVNEESCGAHTCFSGYRVLTTSQGTLTNIVQLPPEREGQGAPVISVSYPDARFADQDGDGVLDLLVHGGAIDSAGAGIVRTYTEVWSWNGTAVTLADTILDPTEYRHHILYEANLRLEEGNLDEARRLYEAAINDDTLITPEFLTTPEETYSAISQFAAARLILLDLWQGNVDSANGRLAWLQQNYPGTPLTEAAGTLVNNWGGQEQLPALCGSIETMLVGSDNPTGALNDLGYGNPSLQAEDFCPETMN